MKYHVKRALQSERGATQTPLNLTDRLGEILRTKASAKCNSAESILYSPTCAEFLEILGEQRTDLGRITPDALCKDFDLLDKVSMIWRATGTEHLDIRDRDIRLSSLIWGTWDAIRRMQQDRVLPIEEVCERIYDYEVTDAHIDPDTWEIWNDRDCPRHAYKGPGNHFRPDRTPKTVHPEAQRVLSHLTEREMTVVETRNQIYSAQWNQNYVTVEKFHRSLTQNNPPMGELISNALKNLDRLRLEPKEKRPNYLPMIPTLQEPILPPY